MDGRSKMEKEAVVSMLEEKPAYELSEGLREESQQWTSSHLLMIFPDAGWKNHEEDIEEDSRGQDRGVGRHVHPQRSQHCDTACLREIGSRFPPPFC
jgi:hypothetical protein